ncbi:MAG: hypothetical protein R2883_00790 [Caldisericia bacterium]
MSSGESSKQKKRKPIYPGQLLNKLKRERLWTALSYEITSEKILFFREELQKKIAEFINSNHDDFMINLEHEMLHTHWHRTLEILEFVLTSEPRIDPGIFNKILEEEGSHFRFYPQEGIFRELKNTYDDEKIESALRKTKQKLPEIHDKIITSLKLYADRKNPDRKAAIITAFSTVEDMLDKITGEKPTRAQIEEVYGSIVPGDGDLRKVSLLTLLEHVERERGIHKWHRQEKLSKSKLYTFSFISACCRVISDLIENLDS